MNRALEILKKHIKDKRKFRRLKRKLKRKLNKITSGFALTCADRVFLDDIEYGIEYLKNNIVFYEKDENYLTWEVKGVCVFPLKGNVLKSVRRDWLYKQERLDSNQGE